jgi:hypothetical protein
MVVARLALILDSLAVVAGRGSRLRGQVGPWAGPVLSSAVGVAAAVGQ